MSSICMYVLRNVEEQGCLRCNLGKLAKSKNCGICCDQMNTLLATKSVILNPSDFAFEVCDSFESNVAELLLSQEGVAINGEYPILPLYQRLQILQEVASTCIPYVDTLEVYLSDNNPYLPDYSDYRVACTDIADILYKEYRNQDPTDVCIPCVHLIVKE